MKETVQQYVQRIQAKIAGKDPLRTQSQTTKRLSGLLKRGSPGKLKKRPAPERWSVAEILAHLADVEMVTGWRLRSILAAPGTPIQAFDQDAWARNLDYGRRKPKQSLETFRRIRAENYELLKDLPESAFTRTGNHLENGTMNLHRLLESMAQHAESHARQMQEIRDVYKRRKQSA